MQARRKLLPTLAAAALVAALPSSLGAAGQGAPADTARGDTAALGFLRSVVDRRLYSLEGAGVAHLTGTAHVSFEVIVPDPAFRPTALDLELGCDFATGVIAARPAKTPTGDQVPIAPIAINAAQSAFSLLPSRAAASWITTLAQDGELFRIDYKPPVPPGAAAPTSGHWSEWHKADGTPVRRSVTSFRTEGAKVESLTQEIVPAFEEKDGKLLLTALKPGETQGRFSYEFEYLERDGVYLLKKLIQSNEGWRLTLEFTLTAEKHLKK